MGYLPTLSEKVKNTSVYRYRFGGLSLKCVCLCWVFHEHSTFEVCHFQISGSHKWVCGKVVVLFHLG